ncbi:CocE/NonD family hydrolase [Psychroflexus halocasei]|uniref:Xaa-Pro dipeptidyl-peptidase C-terminal domain-containing protein n=1 Tax=Psychroflexus halocasei TaxID=908615 RepID=A0A1H3YS48_9FLAO|nr:CocE/NonD family hydrolase [Psychroflexus halocasei]SEA14237.1 hypothetical protein SAMN05421540_103237 [Psychroflexus halocasei]
MRNVNKRILVSLLCVFSFVQVYAQTTFDVKKHYDKKEVNIEMRDGIKLHTTIYSPKDKSQEYPIIMQRTPYSSLPYGEDNFRRRIGPNEQLMKEGNIIVYQDVRGRWMSEGVYDNMRAYIPNKKGNEIDEASDTYDTIEWLINNVENTNKKVGVWGISYPGFYASYALLSEHPALKAASPQAPIGDFYFDDFHHNGAFLLSYWRASYLFGAMKDEPKDKPWYKLPKVNTEDQYQFFMEHMPLSKLDVHDDGQNVFWNQIKEHPNYDEFWQKRGLIQHLEKVDIKPAVMTVGGLFDAEDLYGPFNTYKAIEKNNDNFNMLVFGPWSHGDWARKSKRQVIGNIHFGDDLSEEYQNNYETVFFNHFLKSDSETINLAEAHVFNTGTKEWNDFQFWPPKNVSKKSLYLGGDQKLTSQKNKESKVKFVSDPKKPVPYTEDIKFGFTPRKFMTDDQRFAARRPDVLVFETEVFDEDFTISGEVLADLKVATTGTAADWIVKIVDVFPSETENTDDVQGHLKLSNYHMMVRSEVFRGRYRDGFNEPKAFKPNKKESVKITLQDINHTFKKGHKLQIQVQSSFFPYIDMNPQTYVDNIFEAKKEDFKKQTHTIFGDSKIIFDFAE